MPSQDKIKEYNSEPVEYCARCYSLNIVEEELLGTTCCGKCGCTDTKTASIEEWERLYYQRYGHKFVEPTYNIRKSKYFFMSNAKLKSEVYYSPFLDKMCRSLYPEFPYGLTKIDTVILLFSKLCSDNRMEELKLLMAKLNKE